MRDCYARLASSSWGGAGVRVDIQSETLVSPGDTGEGIGHRVSVRHFWLLTCPHCLYVERHAIPVPVRLPLLEEQMKAFAHKHDELVPYQART